jgi:hypothetical protein
VTITYKPLHSSSSLSIEANMAYKLLLYLVNVTGIELFTLPASVKLSFKSQNAITDDYGFV